MNKDISNENPNEDLDNNDLLNAVKACSPDAVRDALNAKRNDILKTREIAEKISECEKELNKKLKELGPVCGASVNTAIDVYGRELAKPGMKKYVDRPDSSGRTPLMLVAQFDTIGVAKNLKKDNPKWADLVDIVIGLLKKHKLEDAFVRNGNASVVIKCFWGRTERDEVYNKDKAEDVIRELVDAENRLVEIVELLLDHNPKVDMEVIDVAGNNHPRIATILHTHIGR